jgi:hypothetical protein
MRDVSGALKLGHSRDPERRMKDIGRPVEIVHTTDVLDHVERIERLAHKVLALHGKHIRGEWFEASLDQAITAIEIAVRQAEAAELCLGGRLNRHTSVKRRYDRNLNFKVDQAFFAALDKLRKRETPEMSRSDMVRKLVLEAAKRIR